MIDNADQAINLACELTGASVKDYSAAPVFMTSTNKGCHQWLIELTLQPNE